MDPGVLALRRLFHHPNGEWELSDPKYRTERVDPPDGHKEDYAVLYTGNSLLAAAVECHVLSEDSSDAWTLNLDLETKYSIARYTTCAPGLFLPIDGHANSKHLGLADLYLLITKGPVYAAYQSVGLELFKRFGGLAHGLSWASFHRNQPGRIYAIWHHRKDGLGLKREPLIGPLKKDAEWVALIAELAAIGLTKIRKPPSS